MRVVRILLGALAMCVVMLLAFGITLRVALHGREVSIPDLAGMSVAEASDAALHNGLDLNIESKFYSTTVPAGRILSQAPAAGSRVRRGWQVRVTESLGPQQVTIPDVVGEPVRQATMDIRRMQLDLGALAYLNAPGDPDMVLAQTPPPNAGVDQPRENLLLSSSGGGAAAAMVMPSFVGLSYSAADREAIALGFRVAVIGGPPSPPPAAVIPVPSPAPTAPAAAATPASTIKPIVLPAPAAPPAVPSTPGGPVRAQSPDSGYRVNRGDTVRLIFDSGQTTPASGNTAAPPGSPAATKPAASPGTPSSTPR